MKTNWDHIRYFLAVAREGSVASAARFLGVKHSTVLRRLDKMESEMEVKLFNRLASGYSLTASGNEILADAAAMEDCAHTMGRSLRGVDKELTGIINFTMPNVLQSTACRLLERFALAHPDICLHVDVETRDRDIGRLESDIALRITNSPPDQLLGRKIGTCVVSPYVSATLYQESLTSLNDYHWITCAKDGDTRMQDWVIDSTGVESLALHTNNLFVARDAALAGLGAAFLPRMLAEEKPGLVRLGPPETDYDLDIWLLTHADYRNVARIKALMGYFEEHFMKTFLSAG